MPSEARIRTALEALSALREAFRSAVAAAADEVGARLASHRRPADGRVERTAVELGVFALGRLSVERFSALFAGGEALDPSTLARMERAHATLVQTVARGDELFVARVPPGGELRAVVARALAEAGRAFGAARAAEMARLGRHRAEELDDYVGGFAFRRWNRAERQIAPPLVVEVDGGDAQAATLAEFLDGTQKIVLVLRGEAPPAVLARLITPGVFVLQTADATELARLAAVSGPAIAALVPEDAARFVHQPGDAPACERLSVQWLPEQTPRAALGSFTAFQQAEELALLQELATAPSAGSGAEPPQRTASPEASAAPTAPAGAAAADPADRLAAWLLRQAQLGSAG